MHSVIKQAQCVAFHAEMFHTLESAYSRFGIALGGPIKVKLDNSQQNNNISRYVRDIGLVGNVTWQCGPALPQ